MCATCLSSAGYDLHQGSSGRGFTHVLMDEAAQASEVSALVPIAQGCEKLVLVGDQSQLVTRSPTPSPTPSPSPSPNPRPNPNPTPKPPTPTVNPKPHP